MSRTGESYIGDLRADRCVFLDGNRVTYVSGNRYLRNAVATSTYSSELHMLRGAFDFINTAGA